MFEGRTCSVRRAITNRETFLKGIDFCGVALGPFSPASPRGLIEVLVEGSQEGQDQPMHGLKA